MKDLPLDTVTCADALEFMRGLPDGCLDFVFVDPPYGHNSNDEDLLYHIRNDNPWSDRNADRAGTMSIANDGPEANDLFRACLPEWFRLLQPGCCCCCCCCGGGGPDPQFARWALWMDEVFAFKQMVVWDKGPIGMGWHYRRSYETVLVGEVPGAACRWFDETSAVENVIRPGNGIRKVIPQATQHPTEKPVELAAHFIRLHTRPGDVVLDCFAGSGSTLEACVREGRQFIGVEVDPHWAQVARQRVSEALAQPRLDFSSPAALRARQPALALEAALA